jgi:hypothetical protein
MTSKMHFVRAAFNHMFYKPLYIAFFYTVGCLFLSTAGTYAFVRLRVRLPVILWSGVAAVLPLNLIVYALTQGSKVPLKTVARRAMTWLVARSGEVLTANQQRQIVKTALGVSAAAIILTTVVAAVGISSFVSFLSIKHSESSDFRAVLLFTFLLEVVVMVVLAFLPLLVFHLFTRTSQEKELAEYRERAYTFGSDLLVRVAEEQHYERVNEELISRGAASGR